MLCCQRDVENADGDVEWSSGEVTPRNLPAQERFNRRNEFVDAETHSGPDVEHAVRTVVESRQRKGPRNILRVDVVTHYRSVTPDRDRVALEGNREERSHRAL